jgi:hypothetical protein
VVGAVGTAKDDAILLDAVTNDLAAAVRTDRRQGVNGTLERIERVPSSSHLDRERFVVVVAANFLS